MNCRTLGQKYGALEIRVKRFSSPLRSPSWGPHGTGAGPRCKARVEKMQVTRYLANRHY